MDKVFLSVKAIPESGTGGPVDAQMDIIYGIGSAGVTPFERMLFEKSVGEAFTVTITPESGSALLGHHHCALTQVLPLSPPFQLDVSISAIERAQGHEVVKAMAQATGCGGGCGCGCGC